MIKGIEQGRITEEYSAVVEPFRRQLHRLPEFGRNTMLAHDFQHFVQDFTFAFQNSRWHDVLNHRISTIRQNLPVLLEGEFDPESEITPPSELRPNERAGYERGRKIAPYFKTYTLTFLDSMSYIEALATSDISTQEKSLQSLAGRTVPLVPICPRYSSRFQLNGEDTDDESIGVDGIKFIIFYNLLANAERHAIDTRNDEGKGFVSTTNINTEDASITITNLASEENIRRADFGSWNSVVQTDHTGLFIASMYSAIAGLKLKSGSERIDEGLYKISISVGEE